MLKNICIPLDTRKGFTIVELLVVIVVIGILAAISVIAFNGVKNKAVVATLQSDLSNASKQISAYAVTAGVLPSDTSGLSASDGTSYQYTVNIAENSYCLSGISSKAPSLPYRVSSVDGRVVAGLCAGHVLSGSAPVLLPNAGVVSTLAGLAGTYGFADGTGSSALLSGPTGMAMDNQGNIVFADTSNYRIRKMSPTGVVTTIAGSGVSGYLDGASGVARFSDPSDVVVDSAGNIFVADQGNHKIRKIALSGAVSTFAGATAGNPSGSADGSTSAASFNYPYGLAISSDDTLYVADSSNHRIRKITPAGNVTTIAGSSAGYLDETGALAQFSGPTDVAVASSGTLYVVDRGNRRIRAIAPSGVVTTIAGSSTGYVDGVGAVARFRSPLMVTIDSQDNLYVTDGSTNRRIRKVVTSNGEVTTLAGSGASGNFDATGANATFTTPAGILVDATGGVYVGDQGGYVIRKIR